VRACAIFHARKSRPRATPNAIVVESSDRVDRVDKNQDSILDLLPLIAARRYSARPSEARGRKHRAIQIIGTSLWIARSGNADLTDPATRGGTGRGGERWVSI
jgi:hypothetical protein